MASAVWAGTCPQHPDCLCVDSSVGTHEMMPHADLLAMSQDDRNEWIRNASVENLSTIKVLSTDPFTYTVTLTG